MALRLRTLVLLYAVLVASAPATLLVLQGQDAQEQRVARLEQEALEDARESARMQQRAVRDITGALDLLIEVPAVQEGDPAPCRDVLGSVAAARRDLAVMWRIDTAGQVLCASRDARPDLSDWPPVQAFQEDPARRVGAYDLDPRTGEPVLPLAARVADRPEELLVAAVNFQRLRERMEALVLSGDARVLLVDAQGREVVSSGGPPANEDLLRQVQEERGPWRSAQDGVERLYVAVPLEPVADGREDEAPVRLEGRIAVGIPTGPIDAQAREALVQQTALLLGVLVLAGVAAAVMAHRSFERPVNRLVRSVRRFAAGDLQAQVPRDLPSELGELGEALAGMAAAIDRMGRNRRKLLNHLAHQVRTPLTSLVLQNRVARRAGEREDPDALRRSLAAMEGPLEDLRRKADKLDVVGDLALGARAAAPEPTEAGSMFEDARSALARRAAQEGVEVRAHGEAVRCLADGRLVSIALAELLQNAVAAARPGDHVEMRAERQGAEVLLSVHDPGHDLAQEDLRHLLEPRWTWDVPGERNGLGLGLLIAGLVAQAHGGRLEGDVTETGTWFGLRLKAADGDPRAPDPGPARTA